MDFQVGDRVRNLITDLPGLYKDELGTIIMLRAGTTPIIRWDGYNPKRHTAYDNVTKGHGWFIYDITQIERVDQCMEDLGEFQSTDQELISKFLFGI